jgi:hypothetical protein
MSLQIFLKSFKKKTKTRKKTKKGVASPTQTTVRQTHHRMGPQRASCTSVLHAQRERARERDKSI